LSLRVTPGLYTRPFQSVKTKSVGVPGSHLESRIRIADPGSRIPDSGPKIP